MPDLAHARELANQAEIELAIFSRQRRGSPRRPDRQDETSVRHPYLATRLILCTDCNQPPILYHLHSKDCGFTTGMRESLMKLPYVCCAKASVSRRADRRLEAHPAIAAMAIAIVTPSIGILKSPPELVTRPTAHIAKAPNNEPKALRVPAALETCVGETSCAMVKYIELHVPRPTFTAANTATATHDVATNGTNAHPLTMAVANRNTMRRAVWTE